MRWTLLLDVAAAAGVMLVGLGADQLGEHVGLGNSLGWLWIGGVLLFGSLWVTRTLGRGRVRGASDAADEAV